MRKTNSILTIFLFGSIGLILSCSKSPTKIKFQKIIFHTSGCFGTCPTYHMQLDSDGQVKLFSEFVYLNDERLDRSNPDSSRMGYFTGTIADTTLKSIQTELYKINIDTLNIDGPLCCDGSVLTIIVYYDNKRKYLESMFMPDKMHRLVGLLYSACNPDKLKRTTEKLDIEKRTYPIVH